MTIPPTIVFLASKRYPEGNVVRREIFLRYLSMVSLLDGCLSGNAGDGQGVDDHFKKGSSLSSDAQALIYVYSKSPGLSPSGGTMNVTQRNVTKVLLLNIKHWAKSNWWRWLRIVVWATSAKGQSRPLEAYHSLHQGLFEENRDFLNSQCRSNHVG